MNEYHEQPDPMEELLRERLYRFAPPAPGGVWDRIEGELEEPRRRPLALRWWIAAALLLVLLLGWQTCRYLPSAQSDIANVAVAKGGESLLPVNPMVQPNPVRPGSPNRDRRYITTPTSRPKGPVPSVASNPKNLGSRSELKELAEPTALVQNQGEALANGSDRTKSVAFLPNNIQELNKPYLPQFTHHPPVYVFPASPKTHKAHRWDVGISAGPTWLIGHNSVQSQHPGVQLVISEVVDNASASQMDLRLGFRVNDRWRLETGLSRQASFQETSHHADLRLMDGICLNPYDPGVKNYEFQYGLLSGANRSEVTVLISQVDPHVTMPDDEPFTLHMKTTRSSTDWLLPLTVQRFVGKGRWQAFLRGGVALGWTGKTTHQVEHFTEKCAALCFAIGHKPQVMVNPVQGLSVQYITGAGVQYRLSPRINLAVEPVLNGTLINIHGNGRQMQFGLSSQAFYSF